MFLTGNSMLVGAGQHSMDGQSLLKSMDKNKNGEIDLHEYHHRVSEAFFLRDTDKDGKLTIKEVHNAAQWVKTHHFEGCDGNKDGKLSINEFRKAMDTDFKTADTNRDGALDKDEINKMLMQK
jgi:Ca2+-binding EF-hand superfamily protein